MMESIAVKLESSPVGRWRLDNRLVSRHWGGRCDVIGRQVVGQGGCLGSISVGYIFFGYYGHPLGCRAFFSLINGMKKNFKVNRKINELLDELLLAAHTSVGKYFTRD
jgi:hypothetical protein